MEILRRLCKLRAVARINLPDYFLFRKGTQKKLDQLKEVVQKSEIPFSDVINLANVSI